MKVGEGFENRLPSIDFFRGVVMFLLIGGVTGFYELLVAPQLEGTIIHSIGLQFQHHPWNGLRLWDLGQPFFMFISGVAMVFSYEKRWERGETWRTTFGHAVRRSFLLFLFGWALYHISPIEGGSKGGLFSDILPQLAVASLVAFLLLKRPVAVQASVALGMIVLLELLYRLWPVPGFDQPFTPGHNFGSYVDSILFGQISEKHLVALSVIPAVSHTILGIFAGRFLRGGLSQSRKLRILVWVGLGGATFGLALSPLTPIIRRTCTSSFVFLTGGLALLALALSYWLIEILRYRKWSMFFVIIGMNPIFIYLFALSGGGSWFRGIVAPFTMGLSSWMGGWPAQALTSLSAWGLMWALCYWLHRRRILIKI